MDKQTHGLKKIAVIVPAFNEELSIRKTLVDLKTNNPGNWEIIVVDDHSQDNTLKEAKGLADIVIQLPINLGIGGCVQSGLLYALQNGYEIAIQFDSDGQHIAKEINGLLDCLSQTQADVVIGSRFIKDFSGQFKSSFTRRLGIRVISSFTFLLTGAKVKDPTSGFRVFNERAIRLLAYQHPVHYPEPESFVLLHKHGLRFQEVPALMQARSAGRSSIRQKAIFYMFNVLLGMAVTALRPAEKSISADDQFWPNDSNGPRKKEFDLGPKRELATAFGASAKNPMAQSDFAKTNYSVEDAV